jgi:hypothetical protein
MFEALYLPRQLEEGSILLERDLDRLKEALSGSSVKYCFAKFCSGNAIEVTNAPGEQCRKMGRVRTLRNGLDQHSGIGNVAEFIAE